jgi:16S rRNA (adenine1518-N6/adenine1519-N6)-dimethyltransferase
MIDILEKRIENNDFDIENIDFIINNIDVLKFEPTPPPSPLPIKEGEYNYALIANIPYYITSPILRHFLYDIENPPLNMLILMQKEVAEKIVKTSPQASPFKGEGVNQSKKIKSSVLGLFIAKKSDVFYKLDVPKNSFIPAPKVDSAILLFNFNDKYKDINDNKFFKIIKL